MTTNEIIDKLKGAIGISFIEGNNVTKEELDEIGKWLEAQRPKEYGYTTWHAGTKPEWKVGDILAYFECSTDHEGEHLIGKITTVKFDEEYQDWFYTFENGTGDTEESLSSEECYTISEEYYGKHRKHR